MRQDATSGGQINQNKLAVMRGNVRMQLKLNLYYQSKRCHECLEGKCHNADQ